MGVADNNESLNVCRLREACQGLQMQRAFKGSEAHGAVSPVNWCSRLLQMTMQHEMLTVWCYFYKMGALLFFAGDIPNGKRECKKSAR